MVIKDEEFSKHRIELNEEEVTMFGYNFDELGKVFFWEDRIFRGIYPTKLDQVKDLLTCGLIDELISKGLFPKTTVSPYILEGFEMVLEHEKISPVLYPASWSFDMLKDAALCVLEVNEIARKYGYQTIDSHGFNVLFRSSKPVFVDLGSFVSNTEFSKGWLAYEQFIRYYYYPLRIFKSGNLYIGRAIMSQGKKIIPHSSYFTYRFPILRLLKPHFIDKLFDSFHKYKNFSHFNIEEVKKRSPKKLKPLLVYLKSKGYSPFQKVDFGKLKKKIKAIKLPKYQSQWGDYHDQFIEKNGKIVSTPRFNRIIEIINELKPESVLEVGGNQGMFSELISQDTQVSQVTCSDYDEIAVNKMYNRIKNKKLTITPSLIDVVSPLVLSFGPTLAQRYKSEMVIALALTHHLVLTQKVPLGKIFQQFSKFSDKYVVTEFMPLGLYGLHSKHKYEPPVWYTQDWFREEFKKHYELLFEETLEKNRVLFVGKLLS